MTPWGRSLTAFLVVVMLLVSSGIAGGASNTTASSVQNVPAIQVGQTASLDVWLVGESVRNDPDWSSSSPDEDGITYVASGWWLDVEVDVTAPWAGTFYTCTYPWVTSEFGPYECSQAVTLQSGEVNLPTFPVYVDPQYSNGLYTYYVYLYEETASGIQEVDWLWFTVAVDRVAADTNPETPIETVAVTPEQPDLDDGANGNGDGVNNDESASDDTADRDRGDLLSPRNVALMMLAIAAASLLVQLLRGA